MFSGLLSLVFCFAAESGPPLTEPLSAPPAETASEAADLYRLVEQSALRPLPMDAYPLNLGLPQARRLVHDVLNGRATVVTHVDQLVYYGGGGAMYPRDVLNTSITVNWRMIADELDALEAERKDPLSIIPYHVPSK